MLIKKGSTDRSVDLYFADSTTALPKTGLAYNSSGIDLWYRRPGAAKTSLTEATLSALTDAHSDGGFLEIGNGWYRLDLPDAAFATGVPHVLIGGTVTGAVCYGVEVQLVDFDPQSAASMITGINGLAPPTNWNLLGINGSGHVSRVTLADTVTTLTGHTAQTGDSYARIGANGAGLSAVPWNASWDAEVQSECTDALNAYDPPTNAEMEARTILAASYATAANLQTIDDNVDDLVTDMGNLPTLTQFNARTVTSATYATAANLATVDTVVDAILVIANKLDTALQLDGAVYQFTVNALEQAPSGGGGGSDHEVLDKLNTMVQADGDVYRYTANALELAPSGDGIRDDRDLEPVQHTWQLKRSGVGALKSTNPWRVIAGESSLRGGWNCDLPLILPTGTVISSQSEPELVTLSNDITITPIGHDGKIAKVELEIAFDAAPGSHWIKTTVTNSNGGGPTAVFGEVIVQSALA